MKIVNEISAKFFFALFSAISYIYCGSYLWSIVLIIFWEILHVVINYAI